MRTLFLAILILGLSGCEALQPPPRFDSVEYQHLVYLNITADNARGCNTLENQMMNFYARVLVRYSERTTNRNIAETYVKIQALTQELLNKSQPTDTYCNLKKQNIKVATAQALAVYGGRSHE